MIASLKIKKGDTVLIAKGKDRGKKGKVLEVFPKERKVAVEGVNQKIRHTRSRKMGQKGQKVSVVHPISVANIIFICPSCGKGTRIGIERGVDQRSRICKKCKATLS